MDNRKIILSGAVFMALGVLLGAFGAHALKKVLSPEMLAVYQTGVEYQFYHALGLLLIGLTGLRIESKWLRWSGIALVAGIILFSGSLYALSISGVCAFHFRSKSSWSYYTDWRPGLCCRLDLSGNCHSEKMMYSKMNVLF